MNFSEKMDGVEPRARAVKLWDEDFLEFFQNLPKIPKLTKNWKN
jgi:hypothetical protein